jgi:hypothetical protein
VVNVPPFPGNTETPGSAGLASVPAVAMSPEVPRTVGVPAGGQSSLARESGSNVTADR